MNNTLGTIFGRKSVREFRQGEIGIDTLDLIIRAGMSAPTAVDRRPWEFILVRNRSTLGKLAAELPYAKMAEYASAGIVVAGDINRQWGGTDSDFWVQDCSAATENILLAVESLGLGAVWTALHPYDDRKKTVTDLLAIPPHVIPLCFIPVGIPAHNGAAKDKYDASRIHFEKW